MEYEYDSELSERWQPIRYYTTSLLSVPTSEVELRADNVSVDAMAHMYIAELPLHVVTETASVFYEEHITKVPSNATEIRIRWLQRYQSVAPQQDIAAWLLDNITLMQWDGQCQKNVLYKGSSCNRYVYVIHCLRICSICFLFLSSESYAIKGADCMESSESTVIYFNGFEVDNSRRSLVIRHLNLSSQGDCDNSSSANNSNGDNVMVKVIYKKCFL